jgi:phage gp36-like protein
MAYTTKQQLELAIGDALLLQLCDDTAIGSWDTADASGLSATDRLNACISAAGQTIDGYCAKQFSVPFDSPTPAMIAEIAVSLAAYYLHRRRRGDIGMPEDVVTEWKAAMKRLEGVNAGRLDPGVEPAPTASEQVVDTYSGPDQLFTSDTLEEF